MVNNARLIKHLLLPDWLVQLRFKARNRQQIESAIVSSEKAHDGEIRFAVEASLSLKDLWAGRTARDRALDVFSQLRMWDTEHNNGVLIYFLLADHDFEIIADRGMNAKVTVSEWQVIAQTMEQHCRNGDLTGAVLVGIEAVTALQMRHFPYTGTTADELSNEPVIVSGR